MSQAVRYICVLKSYVSVGLAIFIDALIGAIVCAALASAWWFATGAQGTYIVDLSNLLFFAGGIVLVIGAFLEFFHVKGMGKIYKLLTFPVAYYRPGDMAGTAEEGMAAKEPATGWVLIFIGALLIALSIAISAVYLL